MGWFNKKDEKQEAVSLPELPKLPELPRMRESDSESMHLPQLPSYPSSSYGQKFSQDAIKEAVSGEEEDEDEDFDADESMSDEDEDMMMRKPLIKPMVREPAVHRNGLGKNEPVFVRLDKFEEGLKIFEDTKHKIMEIEKMLREVRHVKEQEEKELQSWETEVQNIKSQFEKIDRDIFSKVY
jgi:hypothetical protein